MIVRGTKLALAFLSVSVAYAVFIVGLPVVTGNQPQGLLGFGLCLIFAALLYALLLRVLAARLTPLAFALSIFLGVAVFYLTVLS